MKARLPLLALAALALPALAYATLSGFARRPLSPGEAYTFGAAVLRATPAHLGGANPVEKLRLGGRALGSPLAGFMLVAGGRAYTIPLPPRTVRAASRRHPPPLRHLRFRRQPPRKPAVHPPRRGLAPPRAVRQRARAGARGRAAVGAVTFHADTRVRRLRFMLSEDR